MAADGLVQQASIWMFCRFCKRLCGRPAPVLEPGLYRTAVMSGKPLGGCSCSFDHDGQSGSAASSQASIIMETATNMHRGSDGLTALTRLERRA